MRIYAIRDLLIERGVLTQAIIDRTAAEAERKSPATGAAIVARAWTDPQFRAQLVADPPAALRSMGIETGGEGAFELVVLENTDTVRHVIVCTLCSCYPRAVLGRPPDWYKSAAYRARAVADPRGVLCEFGTDVGPDVELEVHDSTADVRYLVVPQRPPGSDYLNEEQLARLVNRDSLIGVRDADDPSSLSLSQPVP